MSPWFIIIAGTCVIVGSTFGASMWLGRTLRRRAAATRRAEWLAEFEAEPPCDPTHEVEVLLADEATVRLALFRSTVGWIDAETLRPLDSVIGWRPGPTWSTEVVERPSRSRPTLKSIPGGRRDEKPPPRS